MPDHRTFAWAAAAALALAASLRPTSAEAQGAPPPPVDGQPLPAAPPPPPGYGQAPPVHGQPPPVHGQPPPGYAPPGYAPPGYAPPGYGPPGYGPPGYGPPGYGPPGYAPPGYYGPMVPAPAVIEWEEGETLQPGYHLGKQRRRGLIIAGAVTFGSTYTLSVAAAALSSGSTGGGWMLLPCVGPFITAGQTTGANRTALVMDGIVQTGGLTMLALGIFLPRTVQIRNETSQRLVLPTPMSFGRGSAGLGFAGVF